MYWGIGVTSDAPWMIAGWIGAAYWFTASTSFANPAITVARSISDTFAGIRPADAPLFIVSQVVGALIGLGSRDCFSAYVMPRPHDRTSSGAFR